MELLDWLAYSFQDNGWNVKQLMRTMVTSHTYRQSSRIADEGVYQADPENRLLARASRHRLPAWMLRDQALAASGLLSPVSGGPSVNTYQPEGIWEEASFGKRNTAVTAGKNSIVSLYTYRRRIMRQRCSLIMHHAKPAVKASRTNTPLALQTLNNTAYVEAARILAERTPEDRNRTRNRKVNLMKKQTLPASTV